MERLRLRAEILLQRSANGVVPLTPAAQERRAQPGLHALHQITILAPAAAVLPSVAGVPE